MKNVLSKIKKKLGGISPEEELMGGEEEYVELGAEEEEDTRAKIVVRPFRLEEFEDVKMVVDSLREGKTIALINIKPLKEKDILELKRVINKLRKTCDALGGEIAGLGEDYVVATPAFARIYRTKQTPSVNDEKSSDNSDNIGEE